MVLMEADWLNGPSFRNSALCLRVTRGRETPWLNPEFLMHWGAVVVTFKVLLEQRETSKIERNKLQPKRHFGFAQAGFCVRNQKRVSAHAPEADEHLFSAHLSPQEGGDSQRRNNSFYSLNLRPPFSLNSTMWA